MIILHCYRSHRMPEAFETVVVPRELETLIPAFLANRGKELDALRAALAAANFTQLREIGHRMKGVGASYGFTRISSIGAQIESAARSLDRVALAGQIEAYAGHLRSVRVVYG
ncbi:MAG: hypothetical protein A2Z64_12950 [Betaproteobacteria bacterium RIFCSPLOWO2_02_67_12]|nr:MAG: hypothetical protein A2Z64_12950 [Betaproteobacteria bacterium RIFCSPLOWO2_02_67_12]OGA26765.1 MAG: hypothetical protein A3I65_05375 [Betaproteobacteria bacterium RIFCSPLOWO2_02_FULL_68_150]OGA64904.1 MAG: hypothetical protein A3F77_02005 [Betaproteobacteria bacterium RIFCSPLOWO2_12_FULL_67_28]